MQESTQTTQHPHAIMTEGLKTGGCPIIHSNDNSPGTAVEDNGQGSIPNAIVDISESADQFTEYFAKETE